MSALLLATAALSCIRQDLGDTCFSHQNGACRSPQNLTENYLPAGVFRLNDQALLEQCQTACAERDDCLAIEWAAVTEGHCEIWTVLPTHTALNCYGCQYASFGCYNAQPMAPTVTVIGSSGHCIPAGGEPANYNDLPEGSYRLNSIMTLAACVDSCMADPLCVAVEHRPTPQMCEIWTTMPATTDGQVSASTCASVERFVTPRG